MSIQRKATMATPSDTRPLAVSDGGKALPDGVRGKMEGALGMDFSRVRVHEGPQARAMGALAYTQGTDIHFAPGQYQPHSQRGQELIGHELTHVVQQAEGRVQATRQMKGVGLNDNPALEREADDRGREAARAATPIYHKQAQSGAAQAVGRVAHGQEAMSSTDAKLKNVAPSRSSQSASQVIQGRWSPVRGLNDFDPRKNKEREDETPGEKNTRKDTNRIRRLALLSGAGALVALITLLAAGATFGIAPTIAIAVAGLTSAYGVRRANRRAKHEQEAYDNRTKSTDDKGNKDKEQDGRLDGLENEMKEQDEKTG